LPDGSNKAEGGKRFKVSSGENRTADPVLSVVTVVRNAIAEIPKTLGSIHSAGNLSIESILIDGGSTDGTPDFLRAHGDEIDYWLCEPDHGIADAFNKGISIAKGEYVGILNAGDWYEPDALAIVAGASKSRPEIDVFCGSVQFWESGSPSVLCHSDPSRLEKETSVYHPTVFIKKAAYLNYGLYDESYKFAMDYELLLRFKRAGGKFFNIEKTLANMPLDGISHEHWYEGLREVKRARSKYFASIDVAYHHMRAVALNLGARALKSFGLRGVYEAYWGSRNRQISSGRKQGT
jgi:glycosyltransferase involved in cell wall biosynthesis